MLIERGRLRPFDGRITGADPFAVIEDGAIVGKTTDGSPWWLRDTRYNEPNGDYNSYCYLSIYNVNPNDVRFNDGSCSYFSTDYLCQPIKKTFQSSWRR